MASLRRRFVTPEGVDLQLMLGSGMARAGGFLLDLLLLLLAIIGITIAIAYLSHGTRQNEVLSILWLLGFFGLRNGWFVLWEMGGRGATPGKRVAGLRVVARDGARLTGGAVLARNAMREVEVFLPLTFLVTRSVEGRADAAFTLCALAWTGVFLLFPLFNRDRLRVGDLVAGTWVVRSGRAALGADLTAPRMDRWRRPTHIFDEAALSLYGELELQALEDVLRTGRADAMAVVADAIRAKAGLPDDGDDRGFLDDYYAALSARLERGLMLGQRRADKHAAAPRPAAGRRQRVR